MTLLSDVQSFVSGLIASLVQQNDCAAGDAMAYAFASESPDFLLPDYSNDNILLLDNRKVAKRRSFGHEFRTVFLEHPLIDGTSLTVKVEESGMKAGHSFVFGVTTCDAYTIRNKECHAIAVCGPSSGCSGRSLTFFVRNCDRVGNSMTFERVTAPDNNNLIKMTGFGNRVLWMRDESQLFRHRNVYPFLQLTGSVEAIRITNQPVESASPVPAAAPVQPPPFRRGPPSLNRAAAGGTSSMPAAAQTSSQRSSKQQVGKAWQCIRCKVRPSERMCTPCHHAVYCEDCFRMACGSFVAQCPKCSQPVNNCILILFDN